MTPARTTRIEDIDGPPIPGQFYMVPTVLAKWIGTEKWYPVRGPIHTDDDPINFRIATAPDKPLIPHVHLDVRFMNFDMKNHNDLKIHVAFPLCEILGSDFSRKVVAHNDKLKNIVYRRLKCRHQTASGFWKNYEGIMVPWRADLQKKYGWTGARAKLHEGRWICPHRGVDITSEPVDDQGRRTCPLHGLVLKCNNSRNLLDGKQHMEFPGDATLT